MKNKKNENRKTKRCKKMKTRRKKNRKKSSIRAIKPWGHHSSDRREMKIETPIKTVARFQC